MPASGDETQFCVPHDLRIGPREGSKAWHGLVNMPPEKVYEEAYLFKEFIDTRFGGNMVKCFRGLDKNGDMSLDHAEFVPLCKCLGYQGDADRLFRELDDDGSGSISVREFFVLANLPPKEPVPKTHRRRKKIKKENH